MNSPLGKYSQQVAAVVVVGTLAAYFLALFLTNAAAAAALQPFAYAAIGSVLTAAAVTNGWKQVVAQQFTTQAATNDQITAIHARLDQAGIGPAAQPVRIP